MSDLPRYPHNCAYCTFLGRSDDGAVDLYHCTAAGNPFFRVVADDCDIPVPLTEAANGARCGFHLLYAVQAYARAKKRGLVGAD